jgi:small GTP-binding protein
MFDITQKETFDDIKKVLSFSSTISPYLTSILIPNKQDLETTSEVSALEINQFASSINNNNVLIHKTSCKANTGIDELAIDINKAFNKGHKLAVNIVTECTSKQKAVVNTFQPAGFLRIVLLGDSSVGKTAFMNRFFSNTFSETFLSTIGIDDATTFIKIQGSIYKVTVWDTAGQERFRSLPKKYYQNADGIFLLFDVGKKESFDNIKSWMKDIRDNTMKQINAEGSDGLIIYLIGNKIDIVDERVITREMAERQANELNMKYYEVSCKANINIIDVMSKMIVDCFSKTTGIKDAFALNNTQKDDKSKKKKCC